MKYMHKNRILSALHSVFISFLTAILSFKFLSFTKSFTLIKIQFHNTRTKVF